MPSSHSTPVVETSKSAPRTTKVRLQQIAEAASVSLSTVSRVANGVPSVNREIQRRVREAAAHLGVDMSRRNKARTLVFVLSNRDVLHPFHAQILVGAAASCAAQGWDMLFVLYRYSANVPRKELHLPQVMKRHELIRSVILAGTNTSNLLDLLNYRGIPFVALGNNVVLDGVDDLPCDAVYSDDIEGAYEMTAYLQRLGHREIWFVGNLSLPWATRCFQGYQRAMREQGLSDHLGEIDSADDSEVGYLGTKLVLGSSPRVTAILGATDETARGIYRVLRERGLRVPDDISVAGCNDGVGSYLNPPLTTIREFPQLLGKRMVDLALDRIAHPELPRQRVTIPIELVKRASCAAVRSSPPLPSPLDNLQNGCDRGV
jgi:DNA-binding LacI/PurR family transcriptional regulator